MKSGGLKLFSRRKGKSGNPRVGEIISLPNAWSKYYNYISRATIFIINYFERKQNHFSMCPKFKWWSRHGCHLPFHNGSIKMLAFFSVTLKWRDFVYPRLCLFNILLSGGVSDRLFSRQSLQTASKHSTASSNRTIFNFPLLQRAGKCDWGEHHNGIWLKWSS